MVSTPGRHAKGAKHKKPATAKLGNPFAKGTGTRRKAKGSGSGGRRKAA